MHSNSILMLLLQDKRGATAIEYGLIAALIAVAAIVAMRSVGDRTSDIWVRVTSEFANSGS